MTVWRRARRLVGRAAPQAAIATRLEIARLRGDIWYHNYEQKNSFFRNAFGMLSFNQITGDYAEFGSWGATTFIMAHRQSRTARTLLEPSEHHRKLWAFDSFQGLPAQSVSQDEHPQWIQGTMRTGVDDFHALVRQQGVSASDYTVVPGFYDTTLRGDTSDLPTDICLAYIDCDLYSSTKNVLDFLLPRLKHGMVLAFDDYFNYSSTQASGERTACLEVFSDNPHWQILPYIQYASASMSFVVEAKAFAGGGRGE